MLAGTRYRREELDSLRSFAFLAVPGVSSFRDSLGVIIVEALQPLLHLVGWHTQ